jgi:large subunit ribosomal protein L6
VDEMVKLDRIVHNVSLPEGVSVSLSDNLLTLTKGSESISREFRHRKVVIAADSQSVVVTCDLPRRKEKAVAGTWNAHLKNMVKGVNDGFTYKLKVVYSHFPMTLKVQGDVLMITNLFGEKVPRRAALPWSPAEVTVKIENKTDVYVTGIDIEKVGQTAANIERACRIRRRDRRVFQDGIYIVEKAA